MTVFTHLTTQVPGDADEVRTCEPITVGVPFPQSALSDPSELVLIDDANRSIPLQCEVTDRWPADGSIRWVLIDCQLSAPRTYTLGGGRPQSAPSHSDPIEACGEPRGWRLTTGGSSCVIAGSSTELFRMDAPAAAARPVTLRVTDAHGRTRLVEWSQPIAEAIGPLRATVRVDGVIGHGESFALNVTARITRFAGLPAIRVELTLLNPRRAAHKGGYWELGDSGSTVLRDVSLIVACPELREGVLLVEEPSAPAVRVALPASIHQESSGGANWQSRVHVDCRGGVPLRFRGYRVRAPGVTRDGDRATPILVAEHDQGLTAITVRYFWQEFPKALATEPGALRVALFPAEAAEPHELQGGEQKTHTVGIAFGPDSVGRQPIVWVVKPAVACVPPTWYAEAAAVPHLSAVADPESLYERAAIAAIEGDDTFERKREVIDEYGWRNFGDVYADHEAVSGDTGCPPLVSHYNNQYDAINGFAIQFMRSADPRWWAAMEELARHVVDIDIYHTSEDKAAYNGGLLWHTFHYKDAGRSTHRSYPAVEGLAGGGPSNEHDYSTGLMHFFFLTGHRWARDAVIGLADWVLAMDDGRRTVFRWLSSMDTGLASATASPSYHGPGRGAANSIVTLLNAFRLTRADIYLAKAQRLIRRCIHPDDDIPGRNLLDAERRWSYTVFLQALTRYLDDKASLGQLDAAYAYARESLRRYARWMAEHEYPYLEKPEILEYPTETWAAQDMRKCEVFLHAARHESGAERRRLRERADFFYRASLEWLYRFESRTLARPVVLMLSYGFVHSTAEKGGLPDGPEGPAMEDFGLPERFVPQKEIAFRRAKLLVGVGTALAAVLCLWLLTR